MCQLPHVCLAPMGSPGERRALSAVDAGAQGYPRYLAARTRALAQRPTTALDVTSGTAVWYRIGQPVLPIRWVLVRDPKGRLGARAYFSTRSNDRPWAVVQQFIKR